MKTPLVLRFFTWGMVIFAISMVLLSLRALRPLELQSINVNFSRRMYFDADSRSGGDAVAPVKVVTLSGQIQPEFFLNSLCEVVHRLKVAGAKVVIVPLPEYLRPTSRNLTSIQELMRDSIVVFGVSLWSQNYSANSKPAPDDKDYWWAHHPLFHRTDIPWGAMSAPDKDLSRIVRFVPAGIRDFNTGDPVPEVIVLALKRYFNIPDKSELPSSPSSLHIGPYSFPIEHDGLSYVRLRGFERQMLDLYGALNLDSDSIMYFPVSSSRTNEAAALRAAWQAHSGKIVIIDWNAIRGWAQANILRSFFSRSFVRVHNEWNVLLITTLVVLLTVVGYIVRNGFMVFLSLVMAAATVFISAWLFNSHDVLFEPVYIIVPILLCGFILPIAKLSGEKRIAEERARGLEEENRRLLDLQRINQPGTRF